MDLVQIHTMILEQKPTVYLPYYNPTIYFDHLAGAHLGSDDLDMRKPFSCHNY